MPMPSRGADAACPLCRRPVQPDFAPFCSQGCRDRDLLQWLGEGYRLPGRAMDTEEEG
ncbi:DNA gyrase inhibitor YacG [Sphingomonas morindae]|uniref:DNA gyrase inhibitor YacG n=1 Tax=Sphingomonas morindae TaxID=1541170 RepID=UPI003F5D5251